MYSPPHMTYHSTLLHYLATFIERKHKHLKDFPSELSNVEIGAKVSENMVDEISKFKKVSKFKRDQQIQKEIRKFKRDQQIKRNQENSKEIGAKEH